MSGEKLYAEKTLGIFDFMARMLYYLPENTTSRYVCFLFITSMEQQ
jgi:hypothetical protein